MPSTPSYSAPKADPAIGQAAMKQAQTGEDWLKFATEAFTVSQERQVEIDALTKEVTNLQLGLAKDQADWSRSDRERYESTFKPLEDEFVAEARDYASPERQAAAAAEAKADVGQAAAAQKAAAQRESMSLGINPASGRFQGIERAGELGTAVATAGAANNARTAVRDKGLALKADAVNLGRGLPAQSAQAASIGLGGGSAAVGNAGAANQQYMASTGIMGQGYQGAMAGYGGQASTLTNLHNSNLKAWGAQTEADMANTAGLWGGIGTIGGIGLQMMMSDKDAKRKKKPVKEGAALEAVKKMPVEEWEYKEEVGMGTERHVGPYAQDFQEATGSGDGKQIAVQDAIGITMKAVQDLDAKVDKIAAALPGLGNPSPRRQKPREAPRRTSSESAGAKAPAQEKPALGIGLGG